MYGARGTYGDVGSIGFWRLYDADYARLRTMGRERGESQDAIVSRSGGAISESVIQIRSAIPARSHHPA